MFSAVTMKVFFRQTAVLVKKNLLLVRRKWFSTFLQAYFLPILVLTLVLNTKNFNPKRLLGIGGAAPIRSLRSSLDVTNKDFVIISNSSLGSDVQPVIDRLLEPLSDISHRIVHLDNLTQMDEHCTVNLRGSSNCHAAIAFQDSPLTKGGTGNWSYAIILDPTVSDDWPINPFSHDNNVDKFHLPLQLAVDNAITKSTDVPEVYTYTSITQADWDENNRLSYLYTVMSFFLIVYFLIYLPILYHAVNQVTLDREVGMSQLIDAMGGGPTVRVLSSVTALNLLYLPTWIITGSRKSPMFTLSHYCPLANEQPPSVLVLCIPGIQCWNPHLLANLHGNRLHQCCNIRGCLLQKPAYLQRPRRRLLLCSCWHRCQPG